MSHSLRISMGVQISGKAVTVTASGFRLGHRGKFIPAEEFVKHLTVEEIEILKSGKGSGTHFSTFGRLFYLLTREDIEKWVAAGRPSHGLQPNPYKYDEREKWHNDCLMKMGLK